MKKIPCLFARDFTDKEAPVLLRDVTPGCEWVLAGDGVATRKRDGTACAVIGGKLFKRYDVKRGKTVPQGAIPCDDPDPITGHWPHWIEVDRRIGERLFQDGLSRAFDEAGVAVAALEAEHGEVARLALRAISQVRDRLLGSGRVVE